MKPGVVDADFSIPLESLVWSQEQMIALGQLAKGGDINKLIYPDIRKEALARIGQLTRVSRLRVVIAGLDPAIHLLHENILARNDGPAGQARGRPSRMGEDFGSRSDAAWVR